MPSPNLSSSLKGVSAARARGDIAQALRLVDRAYRMHATERAQLFRPYAELLAAEGHDDRAALAMLERARTQGTDAALEATLVRVLLRCGELVRARAQLDAALARLAFDPAGPLAAVAKELVRQDPTRTPGFMGLTRSFQIYGWAPGTLAWEVLVDSRRLAGIEGRKDGTWLRALGSQAYSAQVEAHLGGVPVAGSAAVRPADFGLTASFEIGPATATVMANCEWDPAFRPVLQVQIGKRELRVHSSAKGYRLTRAAAADDEPWHLAFTTPAGGTSAVPGSPLLWPRAARRYLEHPSIAAPTKAPKRAPTQAPRRPPTRAPLAVIVPVYGGADETLACLQAVRRTMPAGTRLVVVDDATPEAALAAALDGLAKAGELELLRHPQNLGFAAAVNTALATCADYDVVLLNADTLVRGDWLERLTRAAYARGSTGTVTPWSGDGSVVSYPLPEAGASTPDAATLDTLVASQFAGQTIELPVGVGFCLFIRHDCHAATGMLAAEIFGRGYGEENDFCLRARTVGYRSVLAADVFVEHLGGRSFGNSRAILWERAQRLVELRHPGYAKTVSRFLKQDRLRPLRRQLDEARLVNAAKPVVLLVSHAMGGGVGRFVATRSRELEASGHAVVLLAPAGLGERQRVRLASPALALQDLVYDTTTERGALLALLRATGFLRVELNHILDVPFALVDALYQLGAPVHVQLHDYAYLCPQVTLMGPQQRYCGEPGLSGCVSCVRAQGSSFYGKLGAAALRKKTAGWLEQAERILAPSQDTAVRYARYFPYVNIDVLPHAPVMEHVPMIARPVSLAASAGAEKCAMPARRRVALLGGIGDHKGYQVLLACARLVAARDLPLEFVVIGYTQDDETLSATGRVFITGPYADLELLSLLRRERPDIVLMASVWPETWSYTLDAALATGLPLVAFDIGAIGERLAACPRAQLLPLTLSTAEICAALAAPELPQASPNLQLPLQGVTMANAESNAIKSTIELLPLPAGIYLFSVQAGASSAAAQGADIALPALHVGPGPGTPAADVEVMGRSGESAGWLVENGDFLVLRLRAPQTNILVTSVQDAAGSALTVRAERLDARFEGSPTATATAQPQVPSTMPGGDALIGLPLQVSAHIRNRGDMSFSGADWAGRVEKGLWVESFSLRPLAGLKPTELEYKSLTSSGYETPWISDNKLCGTQGMGVPLLGFAVRMKAGPQAAKHQVEYTGYFASGAVVGPLKNGVPCRSTVASDPLEGLLVRILPHSANAKAEKATKGPVTTGKAAVSKVTPPKAAVAKASVKPAAKPATKPTAKPVAKPAAKKTAKKTAKKAVRGKG